MDVTVHMRTSKSNLSLSSMANQKIKLSWFCRKGVHLDSKIMKDMVKMISKEI